MTRFLHLADVHLGYTKYDSPTRTLDFFVAFQDALEKYALGESVDFVLIAGDLFEHRQVLPSVLNQAQVCLERLKAAGIPVFAIEGNHDYEPYGTKTSWLRYLASWDKLILLRPEDEDVLEPWDCDRKTGSYIDLDCGVRIIGSRWYGAAAPRAIDKLARSIQALPPAPPHTVMMFHHGLEGHVARYAGALRYQDFLPLRAAGVSYLALGHIHQNYSEADWIFNPGSVEANSVAENQDQMARGVYLVELTPQGIQTDLKRDYQQRPILRLALKVNLQQTPTEVAAAAIALVQEATTQGRTQNAIVELRIHGNIGFERMDLNVRELRECLCTESKALIFLLRYDVTGAAYKTFLNDHDQIPNRADIERTVFSDFLAANVHYQDQADALATGLIDLKSRVLAQESVADLYDFIDSLLSKSLTDG
ncbi:DNA repair exonuclease [Synechococcales cyanobacterium C]|uniref:Nuclease SbcCD subunit D n=1 Tax=Petrachloros mirabilis ULC683 TaxID=2781853 RepID=A0A8K1ZXT7_9CYAN|nr:DNA repair exonuclease [Petrachloros mirabilis]NCJ06873.1 DNA repair exonuclease [Petrachloros mirabilis ULC683]